MNLLLIALAFLSGTLLASTDFLLSSQHITITHQHQTAWQFEAAGRHALGRKLTLGLSANYLERFSFYEKAIGGIVGYRFSDRLSVEGRYILGESDTQILPREQRHLTAYYALASGLTPYLSYRDNRYSVTRVHLAALGVEIEKIPHLILIPQVMAGRSTFSSPAGTESVYSYGLRAMYYEEKKFTAFLFGYRGREASQGIVGRSNVLVDTTSGGLGGSWSFCDDLRTELVVDHTDYDQLKRQFITTTLNLYWTVDS